ncbi:hypothetical protein GOV13_02655 [Candidatus Pacearchaeota archaeon]|nr:hypothetical protein [Candidatus Pacearchaeota archaeon]
MKVPYERYEFELIDIQSVDFSLMELEDLKEIKPAKMKIIGFLVKKDEENYYLAKEVWETGQFKYVHIVPKSYVIKERYLK